jgi:ribosome biogenesis protein Tsr3
MIIIERATEDQNMKDEQITYMECSWDQDSQSEHKNQSKKKDRNPELKS